MMSYEEERMFKATVTLKYVSRGFVDSAKDIAKRILESNDLEDIKVLVDTIVGEYGVVDDAKKDMDYVKSHFFVAEEETEGSADDED